MRGLFVNLPPCRIGASGPARADGTDLGTRTASPELVVEEGKQSRRAFTPEWSRYAPHNSFGMHYDFNGAEPITDSFQNCSIADLRGAWSKHN